MNASISLSCTTTNTDDGQVTLRLEAVNRSQETLHVLTSTRLPYVVFVDGRVIVLYGVNDPDPDLDYYGIEIPLTRPLAPGEQLVVETTIIPLVPRDHYGAQTEALTLPSNVEVICKLAYGETPINEALRAKLSINSLLAWQHWVAAPPIHLHTP